MSSGVGMVLSIAKDALAAQQYGINVTGQNIANVNTPGYSRQRNPKSSAAFCWAGGSKPLRS